jgi:transposase
MGLEHGVLRCPACGHGEDRDERGMTNVGVLGAATLIRRQRARVKALKAKAAKAAKAAAAASSTRA